MLFVFKKPTDPALANISTTEATAASLVPLELPLQSSPLPANASSNEKILDSRITSLEKSLTALTAQVATLSLKSSPVPVTTTPAPTSTATAAQYITLGTNAISNDQGYTSIPGFTVTLSPADFPGYTSVTLEATLSRVQPGGTGYLQLYNQTTSQQITASNVSTTSTSYQLVASSPFQLATGSNTYTLQLQSTDNTNLQVGVARLKVNFD